MNPSIFTAHARVLIKSKLFATAALFLAGTLSTGAALARGDVQWSVTIGVPVYAQHAPVYWPAPVYYPAPVYQSVPVYTQPAPAYRHHPQHSGHHDPYYRPNHYPHHTRHHYRQPTHWDHDGDGIPNRNDRVHNPRWDRDGDGVPNRHDRNDDRHWRGR